MAKLVILNQGMTGRAYDLKAERTTVGRVEDNAFQIADPSVSSHHCEILLRGSDVVIKDLNSTNGSYINNAQITESTLQPGQTLRLGQVELKLEIDGMTATAASATTAPAPATAAASAPAAPPPKKPMEATMVMPRGVSLDQLEQGGKKTGFDTSSTVFKKKRNKGGQYFWIAAGIGIFIIVVLIVVVLSATKH